MKRLSLKMKKIDLGQTVSILANVGVLAGLVFVGMQLQQAERIALGDGLMTASQRQYLIAEAVGQAPDIWVNGLAGKELSDEERAHFEELAEGKLLFYYANWYRSLQVGNRRSAADRWVRETALDLYDHPGLMGYWEVSRERQSYTIGSVDEYGELVATELEKLQRQNGVLANHPED